MLHYISSQTIVKSINKAKTIELSLINRRFLSLFIPAGSSIQREEAGSQRFRQIHQRKSLNIVWPICNRLKQGFHERIED